MPQNKLVQVEHVLIHIFAVFFTFFSIFGALVGYSLYSNQQERAANSFNISTTYGAGTGYSFAQDNFVGGTSSDVYTIPWSGTPNWTKYSSGTNLTTYLDTGKTKLKSTAPGAEFISSVFDSGTQYKAVGFGQSGTGTLYVRGGSSPAAVSSASWQSYLSCLNQRYFQYRAVFSAADQTIEMLLANTPTAQVYGIVKDAGTGQGISDATVTVNGSSVTTAAKGLQFIPGAQAAGPGGPPTPGSYTAYWAVNNSSPTTYDITASKSGYTAQTKSVSINPSSCSYSPTANFSLSKPTSSSSPSPSTSPSTSSSGSSTVTSEKDEPSVKTSTFQATKLPSLFVQKNSATTDLSKVSDPKQVKDFTLEVVGQNKIVFTETLDLSKESTVAALAQLDKYVKIDQPGKIEIDSEKLPALNKRAVLTMSGLKFIATPEILVNGKKSNPEQVSDITYKDGVVTFAVAGFSTYTAVPKLELTFPESTTINKVIDHVKGRISDPKALMTGKFNETALSPIEVEPNTGEFTISNLTFNQGKNTLVLEAKSELGTVLPLHVEINFNPGKLIDPYGGGLIAVLLLALLSAILLWYFIWRKKKRQATPPNAEPSQPA